MQEAILKVKMDLGNEALILNTRKVRQRGLLKIFSKPMVEVLAAVDEYPINKEAELHSQNEKSKTLDDKNETIIDKKEEKINFLENKVKGMESILQKVYSQLQSISEKKGEIQEEKQQELSKTMESLYNSLLNNEIEASLSKHIIKLLKQRVGENANKDVCISALYKIFSEILGEPETIKLGNEDKPTVVIFVGPTGVGKTTTLAKIAANYALNHKKEVGLITADTYRIAAVEQLKTYAEILGIPVSIVYTPSEIREAIDLYSDKDLVLIDTAGRSYQNKSQFEELKNLIEVSNADEIYLVLSTTTSIISSKEILKNYSFLKDYKLIFTKIDEAPVVGIVLNIRFLTGKKLSYITTGQNVPDDIEVANIDKLIKKILGRLT